MNVDEIEDEIHRLEHSETTYRTCEKLSTLYTERDGLMKQAYLYTVAVRGRNESSAALTERGFAQYLSNKGLSVYNITLKYPADYSSESVRAEWFGESDGAGE